MDPGKLFVVATPIGNLDDISIRALEVLSQANVVAAEDTRHSRVLLAAHDLQRPLVSLHEHNEQQQAEKLVDRLLAGESVALISDAGTPLVSDPGYRLLRIAVQKGIEIIAIPGPSALTAALSISGLPTDRFVFEGFLPARRPARRKRLEQLSAEQRTLVFFESGQRIGECLHDLEDLFGPSRSAALCRELTKRFETVLRGEVAALRQTVESDADQSRGEMVLVVAGADSREDSAFAEAVALGRALCDHLPVSKAARVAAKIHGVSRRDLYRVLDQDAR